MKAELVENLIVAHCGGDEKQFKEAVIKLASDEEKKGNTLIGTRLRNAYENKASQKRPSDIFSTSFSAVLSGSSPIGGVPRDKDSLLELYEIIKPEVSFSDVVLPESQTKIIDQIISEQKNAVELMKHNVPPINRVLLCGPPGCGKTMTAYALVHELDLPMAYVRLDGLVSSYLGQTSTNLRKVFDSVKNQRIVLFLDEFDAIAKKRDDTNELGELKRVVTTLLQNFDNMPINVLLIAATNHDHLLDPAIWRRFNVTINLELPTMEQRQTMIERDILTLGIKGKIDAKKIAKFTEGVSGAQIHELMTAVAKRYIVEGKADTKAVVQLLIQMLTNYSDSGDITIKVVCDMLDRGVSLRTAAAALGISHSTLEYQVQKYRGE